MEYLSRQGQPRPGNNLIILLGGVPGSGKTTLGNALVRELGLSHHISTGFIRAAISHLLPEQQSKLLKKHSFDAYEALAGPLSSNGASPVLQGAMAQAQLLKPAIQACIERARREGVGLVLEGSHCIPGILDPQELGADLMAILDVPERQVLQARAMSPNHSRRKLTPLDLQRLVQLQDELLASSERHHCPVIVNVDLAMAVRQVRTLLGI